MVRERSQSPKPLREIGEFLSLGEIAKDKLHFQASDFQIRL